MEHPLPTASNDSVALAKPVKVLYIMGAARCGSTVLDNILNEMDGFFSAGELRFLWERLHQGRRCGCGQSFENCEVWSRVLETVLGADVPGDLSLILARQRRISGTWRTWPLLYSSIRGKVNGEVEAYADFMANVYQTIGRVTDARVIVDSSKRPWDAALLGLMNRRPLPGVSPFFIHLVRDPRAMAYSQSRLKLNPDRDRPAAMKPTGVSRSALQWIRWNLTAEAVRRAQRDVPSVRINYRDFCSDPLGTVRAISALVGHAEGPLPVSRDHTVNLGGNHTVSGNPDRFRTGPTTIREDTKWRREMPKGKRAVATALTFPLALRYARSSLEDQTGS
jgi:hypothetical protein